MTANVATISHDDPMVPASNGQIPVYDISEAARGKTTAQLYQDVLDDRAMKRATGQLLDHSSLTREMLWAESLQRDRRSPADIAGEPTAAEQKRIDAVETAYFAAEAAWKAAKQALLEVALACTRIKTEAETRDSNSSKWWISPSSRPSSVADAERAVADAERAVEQTHKALGEALVRMNNVKANIMARAGQRRADVQAGINRAGFLENLRQAGGRLTAEVKADMRRFYGR